MPAHGWAASAKPAPGATPAITAKPADGRYFQPEEVRTTGAVTVGGQPVAYQAIAGTIVVHPKDWDDVPTLSVQPARPPGEEAEGGEKNPSAEASMFFVAYLKQGVTPETRPLTFLYNGGPGSSSVWLHMGAFGPRRVLTRDAEHSPAAPYQLVNNDQSLLDASDLVFVDAPGTGFSRIAGKDKEQAFYGVDADAHAFADFITSFLSRYGRWNSPKYLFGESYGTTRSAVLANLLETDRAVDFNGVILLSQILNFGLSADGAEGDPGIDLPYVLTLPTYAATAWYHKLLSPMPPDLPSFLNQVEHFATTDYAQALQQGAALSDADRQSIIGELHRDTSLPVDYIGHANLRIEGGEFEHALQAGGDVTTGRLDSRFSGPSMDPLSKESDYDPQSAAISSAYVSTFNDYVRRTLHFGADRTYKPEIDVEKSWTFKHAPPNGGGDGSGQAVNVMPDLASALKYNPGLRVMLNAGYFDLATPFFEGVYEMHHLPMPRSLQGNIEFKFYQSGHMVYAHQAALQQLHDNVADFIRRTDNLPGK